MPESQDFATPLREQWPRWRVAAPGLLICGVAILLLFGASGLPLGNAQQLGPAALPDLLAALLLVLGIVIAVERLSARRSGGAE